MQATLYFLNHGWLWARAWFLKLFYESVCVCVCVYVCMYVCMYAYLFVFPHPREQTFYLKLKSSLYTNDKG